jgi:nitrite reductase/ring-hydroxylating ferredoxin subunit/uncharacterized membrane protein
MSPASPLHMLVERVGEASVMDAVAQPAAKAVRSKLEPGAVKDALSGTWLGHAVHPLLTDVVIGTWTSALLLDVAGGRDSERAVRRLIGMGIVAYPVTTITGVTDWADAEPTDARVRRIGIVHASTNGAALALQAASLRARRRGARGRGVALSLAATGALTAGGYLGAHLSYVHGVGVDRTTFDPGPEDWTAAARAGDVCDGEPVSVVAGETPVLLLRSGGRVRALHDRCSHRGCSLAAGTIDGDVVECACHGSRFSLDDGSVLRGPATTPQPAFDVRERDGDVEVRLRAG